MNDMPPDEMHPLYPEHPLLEAKEEAERPLAAMPCSAGWFLTGWQRKWTRTTGNDRYVARVYSRCLDAEDRYQRENKMGRYSLPNDQVEARRDKTPPQQ
jgi:hypothetical protein